MLDARTKTSFEAMFALSTVLVGLAGFLVIIGWVGNVSMLRNALPGATPMAITSSFGFFTGALALLARRTHWPEWIAATGSWLVLALGAQSIIDTVFFGGGHLNRFLTGDILNYPLADRVNSGTVFVAPATGLCFLLLGLAILLINRPHRVARWAVIIATSLGLLISGLALVGYIYGVPGLYAIALFNRMAFDSSLGFVFLFAACLLAHPERGWVRVLTSAAPGGTMARRLVPLVVLLPAIVGWVMLQAVLSGAIAPEFALALLVVLTVIPLTALLCRYGRVLDALDAEQRRSEARQRRRTDMLTREVDQRTKWLQKETAERLKAEQALRQAQKMEAIGQLTGGIAHDFNNLLTVVGGSLDLIRGAPTDTTKVIRLADSALVAVDRCARLIKQLLMFARRQVMHPETVNPNRLIVEFEPLISRATGEDIELATNLDPILHPSRIDPVQFEGAILNLVVNAREAISGPGKITIETRNAVLDSDSHNGEIASGSYVMVAVSDNGSGIPPELLAKVFDPFVTTKEVGKGSGLGLSQVYGFAKESGGHVRIYSEIGVGTTVRLYLPQSVDVPVEAENAAGLVPLRRTRSGETILVVEDDEPVLDMAVESLKELGYQVLTAPNAIVALEIIKSDAEIDVLFSDVVMPGGMNGVQLAVEARRRRPSLKVLLTSGYTASALASQHGLQDNIPLLGKPYRPSELAAKFQGVLGIVR